jgi:hypothetical protein
MHQPAKAADCEGTARITHEHLLWFLLDAPGIGDVACERDRTAPAVAFAQSELMFVFIHTRALQVSRHRKLSSDEALMW